MANNWLLDFATLLVVGQTRNGDGAVAGHQLDRQVALAVLAHHFRLECNDRKKDRMRRRRLLRRRDRLSDGDGRRAIMTFDRIRWLS